MASGRLVDYLGHGNIADRPVSLTLTTDAIGFWWSDDTSELSLWDGSVWEEDIAGGGGSSTLAGLSDVDLTGLSDLDVLSYDLGSGMWIPASPAGGSVPVGGVLGSKRVTVTGAKTYGAGTAVIPYDNVADPLISEGAAMSDFDITYTPTDATSEIEVDLDFVYSLAGNYTGIFTVWAGSTLLGSILHYTGNATWPDAISKKFTFIAGTTSPIAFTVRGGGHVATTVQINTDGSVHLNNTVKSQIKITEYKV